MRRIIIGGDIHISARHLGRSTVSLDWLGAAAVELDADLIIIAGDLFDGPRPTPQEYRAVLLWLRALEGAGVEVLILEGNHDQGPNLSSALEPLEVCSHAKIVRDGDDLVKRVWELPGVSVALLPYPAPGRSAGGQTRAEKIEQQGQRLAVAMREEHDFCSQPRRILIAHHTWQGAEGLEAQPLLAGDVGAPLPDEFAWDLILTGHIHKRQRLRDAVWYLGAVDRMSHTEADYQCGAMLVDVDFNGLHCQWVNRAEDELTRWITVAPGELEAWTAREGFDDPQNGEARAALTHLRVRGAVASVEALEAVEQQALWLAQRLASIKLEVYTQRATAALEASTDALSVAELLEAYRLQRPGLIEGEDVEAVAALVRDMEVMG